MFYIADVASVVAFSAVEQAMFDVPGAGVNAVYVDEDAVLGKGRYARIPHRLDVH